MKHGESFELALSIVGDQIKSTEQEEFTMMTERCQEGRILPSR